jgi:3-hydroxyacyl-[acyl-carrier-protein] dehydratase
MSKEQQFEEVKPLRDWNRKVNRKRMIWLLLVLSAIAIPTVSFLLPWFWYWFELVLVVLIAFFSLWIQFDLRRGISSIWFKFELGNLVKEPFAFSNSEGLKHYAYRYAPATIDLSKTEKKFPVVIGLHGWGSHHKEMDRYCVPTVEKENCIYFTYDARGQGLTVGDKCEFRQVDDCREFIDKIVSLEPGRQVKAVKNVSLSEEYLGDHFPTFPVLPGVLLLEGLIEAASWLVRESENFAHSMILLEQARNVKYKSFLAPGMQIEYDVAAKTVEETVSSFTGFGISQGKRIVEARFGLRHFNLADENSAMAAVDAQVIKNLKERWKLLKN